MKFIFAFLVSIVLVGHSNPNPLIITSVKEDIPFLVEFYKHRHQHPEISLQEENTAKELATELRKVGFEVTENFGGFGIVGILKNGAGPLILYRTDMDALPMPEKTDLAYASKKGEAMHSCGHDMHMTTWLGTARAMVNAKSEWNGTLMMIGQPAEEIGAGAKMMLEAGLYQKFGVPDFGIGLHCSPTIPSGQLGVESGYTMANTESIDILVKGIGAHGAAPHMSIDPVVVASMIVMDLQTIVSRNLKPTESAVVTVGAIEGGTVHNIIPDEVTLKLTVRTYQEEVRQMVHKRIKEISRGVAIAAGLPEDKMPEVNIPEEFTLANYNDPDMVEQFRISARKAIGEENVLIAEPQMVGEDFAFYGRTKDNVPTVLYWLGSVPDKRVESGDMPGLHSPYYFPEVERTIVTGVSATSHALIDLFNQ